MKTEMQQIIFPTVAIMIIVFTVFYFIYKTVNCKHKFKSSSKKIYNEKNIELVKGTEHYFNPIIKKVSYRKTVEILVCEKCGKTEKVEY